MIILLGSGGTTLAPLYDVLCTAASRRIIMKFVNSQKDTFTNPVPVYLSSMRDPGSFRMQAWL